MHRWSFTEEGNVHAGLNARKHARMVPLTTIYEIVRESWEAIGSGMDACTRVEISLQPWCLHTPELRLAGETRALRDTIVVVDPGGPDR